MSAALFFKRFLQRPLQVASIVPSSPVLINCVMSKFDFTQPRVIAEFGPGEGCHTREIVRRMHPESRLLLFELDPELCDHLRDQFRNDRRVFVLNTDAANLQEELHKLGLDHYDYVVSGIPFSTMEKVKKSKLLHTVYDSLAPHAQSAFIIYQYTNELQGHGAKIFPRFDNDFVLQNIPPTFIIVFFKQPLNGAGHGHGSNGHGKAKGRPKLAAAANGHGPNGNR